MRLSKQKGLFEDQLRQEFDKTKSDKDHIVSQIDEVAYDILGLSQRSRVMVGKGLKHLREVRRMATRGLRVEDEE